jgi:Kdo2-lipid IVA lauroyltransferase/acyltransferase
LKSFIIHIIVKFIKLIINYTPILFEILLWKIKILLKHILKYRKKVIKSNLKNSFGKTLSNNEIESVMHQYYDVLIRYFRESMYIMAWPKEKLLNAIRPSNSVEWQKIAEINSSYIVTASHYGNWEMNMVLLPTLINTRVVAFYKPISNKLINNIMHDIRSKYGLELYPIEQTARIMTKLKNEKIMYIFIGDQTPVNMNGVYWNTFLNQKTPWLNGAEKLAKKYHLPVVYLKQIPEEIKQAKVFYTLDIISINDGKDILADSVTENYTRILEAEIISKPQYWLWSHKRWKRAHLFNEK